MKLLRLEDVADRLSTSRSTARRLLISGVIPVITLRSGQRKRMLRVRPEALERWILSNERRSAIGAGNHRRRHETTTFSSAQEKAISKGGKEPMTNAGSGLNLPESFGDIVKN